MQKLAGASLLVFANKQDMVRHAVLFAFVSCALDPLIVALCVAMCRLAHCHQMKLQRHWTLAPSCSAYVCHDAIVVAVAVAECSLLGSDVMSCLIAV